MFKNIVSMYK